MTERVVHHCGQPVEDDDDPGFVPDPSRVVDYTMAQDTAHQSIDRRVGGVATAAAILALAAQVARIADAIEFAMVNNY